MWYIIPFCSILLYLLPDKRHPKAAEISIILDQHNFIIFGVLGMLGSYEITRGIKLVIGRVTERIKGGLGGIWGLKLVKGVLLVLYISLFSPLEVSYGTRFGSKHHLMVQLVNIYRVGITDQFLDLCSTSGGSQTAVITANRAVVEP